MGTDKLLRAHIGALVRDESRERTGLLMAVGAYCDPTRPPSLSRILPSAGTPVLAYLRPQGGGLEWTTDPEAVTVLSPDETLSAKLRERNEMSSGDRYGRRG